VTNKEKLFASLFKIFNYVNFFNFYDSSSQLSKKRNMTERYRRLINSDAKQGLIWFNSLGNINIEIEPNPYSNPHPKPVTKANNSNSHNITKNSAIYSASSNKSSAANTKMLNENGLKQCNISEAKYIRQDDFFRVLLRAGWDGVEEGKARMGSGSWRYINNEGKKDI
jgi:hypothetical protein